MVKILITGANGYIGKALCNAFKDKYDVTPITRKDADLTNLKEVERIFKNEYFDVVIHCAAEGGSRLKEDGVSVLDNNLKMYYNLLEHQYNYGKFIHFGSGAQFVKNPTLYGLSKHIIAESMRDKPQFYNIIIYGLFDENELDTRFIKSNIIRYIKGEPILIQNKKMDFFYMNDLLSLVHHYISDKANNLRKIKTQYAIYGSPITSLLDIANIINDLSFQKVPIYQDVKEVEDYWCGPNRIERWEYIGLKQGIKNVYKKLLNEY